MHTIWFRGVGRTDEWERSSLVVEYCLDCVAFNAPDDRAENPQPSGLGLFSSKCIVSVFNISHLLISSLGAPRPGYGDARVRIRGLLVGIIPRDIFSGDIVSAGAGLVGSSNFLRSIARCSTGV